MPLASGASHPYPLTPLEAALSPLSGVTSAGCSNVKTLSLRKLMTTFAAMPYRSVVSALEAGRLVAAESGDCEEARAAGGTASLWSRRTRQAPGGPIGAFRSSFNHLPLAGLDRPLQEEHP